MGFLSGMFSAVVKTALTPVAIVKDAVNVVTGEEADATKLIKGHGKFATNGPRTGEGRASFPAFACALLGGASASARAPVCFIKKIAKG